MSHYKELTVWQKSMDLVVEVYRLVRKLPKEELYALSDQMRRAVVSIPSNIDGVITIVFTSFACKISSNA